MPQRPRAAVCLEVTGHRRGADRVADEGDELVPGTVGEERVEESKAMSDPNRFTIICPCCESTLNIDAQTGVILSHEEKQKPLASFEDMAKNLDKAKQTREQIFAQEMSSMKDRERLLDEKFKEAMKRAEKDKDKVYHNPMDLD